MEEQLFVDGVLVICILWGAAALGTITYLIVKKVGGRG